jgi:hypothetical protein
MKKELTYVEALEKLTTIADSLDKKQDELSPEMAEIISTLTKIHKNDTVGDNWDDLFAMFDDIREHAKNNDRAVIEEDRPRQLRLAWRCTNTNKTWSIKIANVKKIIKRRRSFETRISRASNYDSRWQNCIDRQP